MERSTKQRLAIRQALEAADRPLLATEVLTMAQQTVPSLGIATVYRTLKAMVEHESLQTVELPGENPRFEFAHGHHHHFSCHTCGRVYDIHGCLGDFHKMVPPGFEVSNHEVTLYGRCANCENAK